MSINGDSTGPRGLPDFNTLRSKQLAVIRKATADVARDFAVLLPGVEQCLATGKCPDGLNATAKRLARSLDDLYTGHLHIGRRCPSVYSSLRNFLSNELLDGHFGTIRLETIDTEHLGFLKGIEGQLSQESGHSSPGRTADVFLCSKRELLGAYGLHRSGKKFLESLRQAGRLEIVKAEKPVGYGRYAVTWADPAERDRIVAIIMQGRSR